MLRGWRTSRGYSQLDLAIRSDVSAKHLSYVETGRSKPSPEMILHLCEHLDVPMRQRNEILLAAGYAPRYDHTPYDPASPNDLSIAIDLIINAHTFPAIVVDTAWNLITANLAAAIFMDNVDIALMKPPINVIRLSLHPDGLAPRVRNFDQYAHHVVNRLQRTLAKAPSAQLESLLEEFGHLGTARSDHRPGILLPLELDTHVGLIRMFSTITAFGTPRDISLEELAIETFYPADPESHRRLTQLDKP